VATAGREGAADWHGDAAVTQLGIARVTTVLLLVVSAIGFAAGVAAERSAEEGGEESHQAPIPAAVVAATNATHAAESATGAGTGREEGGGEEGSDARKAAERAGAATEAAGETGEAAESHAETDEEAEAHHAARETILGIDPESTGLVVATVALSLLLAGGIWRRGTPALFAGAVAFGLLFAAFDVREAFHQADESRGGLVALALLLAVLHTGVAIAAGAALRYRAPSGGLPTVS
jgi:hypothetical protein